MQSHRSTGSWCNGRPARDWNGDARFELDATVVQSPIRYPLDSQLLVDSSPHPAASPLESTSQVGHWTSPRSLQRGAWKRGILEVPGPHFSTLSAPDPYRVQSGAPCFRNAVEDLFVSWGFAEPIIAQSAEKFSIAYLIHWPSLARIGSIQT